MAKPKDDKKEVVAADAKSEGDGAPDEAKAKPKMSRKKMIIFGGAGLALILGLGAAAYLFLFAESEPAQTADEHGAAASADGHGDAAKGDGHGAEVPKVAFFDLPAILVNLKSGDKPAFLKLVVSLELKDAEATKALEEILPRVIDQFQTYLRELRMEDLSGSAATFRLKEELLRRVNLAASPAHIQDVLFKEMIVQ